MSDLPFVICDVFTSSPLQGNQLGVFTDARGLESDLMQAIARELNFSESTFVFPAKSGGDARVRIFTPTHEVPFAGHPTLGTALVLSEQLGSDTIRLETGAGVVPVTFDPDATGPPFGRMKQPIPTWTSFEPQAELLAALGVGRADLPVELYDNGLRHVYVMLGSEDEVESVKPDFAALSAFGDLTTSCFTGSGTRYKTRVFVPSLGVGEDPATGSAAGPLALHLARHGRIEWGQEIEISQGAEVGRPSTLYARVTGGPEEVESVEVGGSAVIVATGNFRV